MYYICRGPYQNGGGDVAESSAGTESPVVRVGDDDALVFTMRELNQQTAAKVKEMEQAGQPAIITNHGRFIAVMRPLAPAQVQRQVFPGIARQTAKQPSAGTGPPVVRVGDDDALVFTMRELNQRTARIMKQIKEARQPAIITNHGRFIAVITPLGPGQVESVVFPEIARLTAKGEQG
jgi:antitoxin (DNA-binding transcriptional repressor) of toxin-antitoxin stability system